MKHPVIIGAGGVASYLLPVLLKTFRPEKLTIIDKDILEERNLDRQMFKHTDIGAPKAVALADMNMQPGTLIATINDWFSDSTKLPDDIDAIICCADNHEARMSAMNRALDLDINAYVGGNEYLDSQAFVFNRRIAESPRSPLRRYPNIATDKTGSPFRCTGEAQEASPQLAVANINCAAKLLHLIWVYERWVRENANQLTPSSFDHLPVEFFSSLTDNEAI